jgi:hypothetical protein
VVRQAAATLDHFDGVLRLGQSNSRLLSEQLDGGDFLALG